MVSSTSKCLSAAAIVVLALVACGGTADVVSETTSLPPLTSSTSTTGTVAPSTTATTTTTTTMPPDASSLPSYIVAGPDGVNLVDGDGFITLLVAEAVELAMDDGDGGLLFQQQRGQVFETPAAATRVWWIPPGGATPQELLVPAPDQYLELVDAVDTDDSLMVFYLRRQTGESIEESRQTLRRYDVAEGLVTELAGVGGYESNSQVAVGRDVFAVSWAGEGICGLSFLDLAGHEIPSLSGAPAAAVNGGECGTVEETFEISPDDALLAFTDPIVGEPYEYIGEEVAVVDLVTGDEVLRVTLWEGEPGWFVRDLDLDGHVLVVNRRTADDMTTLSMPALIFDFSGSQPIVSEAALPGTVRLVRAPLTIQR